MTHAAFRFAVQTGPFDEPTGLRAHARLVESLGYEELYSADHIGAIDPFLPLVVAAEATERLRFGPLVLNNELHHPVLLARTAATFDRLTAGRLVLGMGTGYDESEHDSIGSPILPPGLRVDRFGESLAVVRELLDTGGCRFEGDHHRVALDELGVRPVQDRVPILIGGHGPRVVDLAGRCADIFQFTGLVHGAGGTPTGAGFAIADVERRARWLEAAVGDRLIERSALVQFVAVGSQVPSLDELSDRFHLPTEVLDDTPFVLVGSVDQVVERLELGRERLGISHVVVRDAEGFAPVVERLAGR